ncbi:MAG TPA: cytochrome P450 [Thermoanaerobaculia bacterium]|jgi:cytochrome P450 PksS
MTPEMPPVLACPRFKSDPFPKFDEMREATPVFCMKVGLRRSAWFVTRHGDALRVLSDPRFVKSRSRGSTGWLPGPLLALSRNMLDVDDPAHRRLRTLVQKAFTPRMVEQLRPRVEAITEDLLGTIESNGGGDLIRDFAAPLPVTVISELLGVPQRWRSSFRRWSERVVVADASPWRMMAAMPSIVGLMLMLKLLIRRKRRTPGEDLISMLIAAQDEEDRLTGDEVLAMAFLLLVAGHETTVNLIGNGILALINEPAQMDELRGNMALLPGAVEEMLRFAGPLQITTERYATEDVRFGDSVIPAGALVYVLLASANRDTAAFQRPADFDVARDPNRHLAFGHGVHYCLGAPLARLEAQIAIRRLLERFSSIQLADSANALRWRPGLTIRGLERLPVVVSP